MPRSNVAIFAGLLLSILVPLVAAQDTVLISANTAGNAGNGLSSLPAVSGDGRYVTFTSAASDLVDPVAGDVNGVLDLNNAKDIFLRDRDPDGNGIFHEGNATTEIITVSSTEVQNGGNSADESSITPSGRFVVFSIPGGSPQLGVGRIFVRDRLLGTTVAVDRNCDGTPGFGQVTVGISGGVPPLFQAEGRFVTFSSPAVLCPGDTNGVVDIFVHDRDVSGDGVFDVPGDIATVRVSVSSSGTQANNTSDAHTISADGRHVAFYSTASNLVENDTNGSGDVFVRDRDTDDDGVFDEHE